MIRFLVLLAALILSVWLGLQLKANPGYILVAYGHYTFETSLWVALVLLLLAFFFLYICLRVFSNLNLLSRKIGKWSRERRMRLASKYTQQGLLDLTEGNWRGAEKKLLSGANYSDTPLINYLSAAKAAQEQGADERRDEYLRLAHTVDPKAKFAVELTQAQLQLYNQQLEQALATLRHLQELEPAHNYVLKLLKNVYLALNDWKSLLALLPKLRKYKVIPVAEIDKLEQLIYQNLLQETSLQGKIALEEIWSSLPRRLLNHPVLLACYISHLIKQHEDVKAEQLIQSNLKRVWDEHLIALYAMVNADQQKQLATAEHWLKTHKKDPILLRTLGNLAVKNQLWGKARAYLEESIELKPTEEAYLELGQLLEKHKEILLAKNCYFNALLLRAEKDKGLSDSAEVY